MSFDLSQSERIGYCQDIQLRLCLREGCNMTQPPPNKAPKKPYNKPALHVRGSLRELTKGRGHSGTDWHGKRPEGGPPSSAK